MRSKDLWFRPIETRVGPGRRALRRRLLQPGGHPQRHARAAARPGQRRRAAGSRPLLRPHLAGAAQAGAEARRAGAEPRGPARADAGRCRPARTPSSSRPRGGWRRRTTRPTRAWPKVRPPMGSKALELYEQARAATTAAARKAGARHVRRGHRQLDPIGAGRRGHRAGARYVTEALGYGRPQALTDFVAAVLPAALPGTRRRGSWSRPPAPRPTRRALKTAIVRAVAPMEAGRSPWTPDDRRRCRSCSTIRPPGRWRCRSWRGGTRPARSARRPTSCAAADAAASSATRATSDERRIDSRGQPPGGAGPPRRGAVGDRADAVRRRRRRRVSRPA